MTKQQSKRNFLTAYIKQYQESDLFSESEKEKLIAPLTAQLEQLDTTN